MAVLIGRFRHWCCVAIPPIVRSAGGGSICIADIHSLHLRGDLGHPSSNGSGRGLGVTTGIVASCLCVVALVRLSSRCGLGLLCNAYTWLLSVSLLLVCAFSANMGGAGACSVGAGRTSTIPTVSCSLLLGILVLHWRHCVCRVCIALPSVVLGISVALLLVRVRSLLLLLAVSLLLAVLLLSIGLLLLLPLLLTVGVAATTAIHFLCASGR
mmetsp:Transcript_24229/g.58508  ORF Transcript_24229/g.58508 Transcript_24229/m.58508 type:complete len:212 (-) Transcript_24229:207-842(-)